MVLLLKRFTCWTKSLFQFTFLTWQQTIIRNFKFLTKLLTVFTPKTKARVTNRCYRTISSSSSLAHPLWFTWLEVASLTWMHAVWERRANSLRLTTSTALTLVLTCATPATATQLVLLMTNSSWWQVLESTKQALCARFTTKWWTSGLIFPRWSSLVITTHHAHSTLAKSMYFVASTTPPKSTWTLLKC